MPAELGDVSRRYWNARTGQVLSGTANPDPQNWYTLLFGQFDASGEPIGVPEEDPIDLIERYGELPIMLPEDAQWVDLMAQTNPAELNRLIEEKRRRQWEWDLHYSPKHGFVQPRLGGYEDPGGDDPFFPSMTLNWPAWYRPGWEQGRRDFLRFKQERPAWVGRSKR